MRPIGGGADDLRLKVHNTLVWRPGSVTDEGSVAEVAIFQLRAVTIHHALTGHWRPATLPVQAEIVDSARVIIVAFTLNRGKFTAPRICAQVVGAGIAIVAFDRCAGTATLNAMVGNRAGVAVIALSRIEKGVDAALDTRTFVLSAVIAIKTEVHVVPRHQGRFVHLSITIIIEAIADLLSRLHCIATRETLFTADPQAPTGAEFVGHLTWRREPQFDGALRTRTFTCIIDALAKLNSIDGDCRQT